MSATIDKAYLRNAVMTATPEQLQLMLYDGAIRYSMQAIDALQKNDFAESFDRLTRAQNILLEMQTGLRHDVNPELCGRVASVYLFLYNKLVEANTKRSIEALNDALKILRIERETWRILVEKVNQVRSDQPAETAASDSSHGGTLCVQS